MMKGLKILSILLVFITGISCSTKKIDDKDINLGMTLVVRAVDYQLQGREKMASYTYNRAVAKFRDMGNFCNMSRTAIAIVTVDPESSLSLLEDARAFATLGRCSDYDYKKLPEPYKTLSKYYTNRDIKYLLSIANKGSNSQQLKSFAFRQAASHILDNDPKYAIELIEKADVIDSKNTWTLNLVKNEKIRLNALRAMGLPNDLSAQRLKILEQSLNDKY